jgi:hypothetical protein
MAISLAFVVCGILGIGNVIPHFILRFIVYSRGYSSIKLGHFLDSCTKLVFLRRVGGGYIFIHRLLLEHFAAMWERGEETHCVKCCSGAWSNLFDAGSPGVLATIELVERRQHRLRFVAEERVENRLRRSPCLYQAIAPQASEVLRQRRLAQTDDALQLAHRLFAADELTENHQAMWVAHSLQQGTRATRAHVQRINIHCQSPHSVRQNLQRSGASARTRALRSVALSARL